MKVTPFNYQRLFVVLSLTYLAKLSICSGDVDPKMIGELAHNIGTKINEFAVRVTGSEALNQELSKLSYKALIYNGTAFVQDVSTNLHQFFNKKVKSLRNIVAKSEKFHGNYKYDDDIQFFSYMNMKDFKKSEYQLEYSDNFKRNISLNHSGVQVPTDIYDEAPEILNTIKWTQLLDQVFKDNFKEDPTLKWQFFGSETGVLRSFPAKEWELGPKEIDLYDARKRSWYIHGSASSKTVVIIVDSSGSMYGRPLLIARLAVGELIDTLSENDYFNIIWFNKDVHYVACEKKFVQATPQNKHMIDIASKRLVVLMICRDFLANIRLLPGLRRMFFKRKLKDIDANFVASWNQAYETAFKLFQEDTGANCQKVIMVFTDGPTERSTDVFDTYNKDKKVRVFTYAVGPPAHSIEALRSIACDNKGYFYRIPDVGSVRDAVKDYVTVLSRPMAMNYTHQPTWSSVYNDISGLGMMITGTLPIFYRPNGTGVAKILGVTGTDVPLVDLDGLVDRSLLGADGYLFLINNNGHIVKHPALKTALGYLVDPPAICLSHIEFGWEVNSTRPLELRKKILETKQGEINTMVFDVAKYSNDELQLRVQRKKMNYFFTTIENTPLRIGIASPEFGFKIISDPGNPKVNETMINFLKTFWENETSLLNNEGAFVQTYDGIFKATRPLSDFKPEQGIQGRIEEYPDDVTVISVSYTRGNATNNRITGYRSVKANISGATLNLAVVGFDVKHSTFSDNYFINASSKDINHCNRENIAEKEGYYCYLLDESGFVVAANAYSEVVTGQFFGKVDSEIMRQLVRGSNSSIPHPIYEKVVNKDYQGSCSDIFDDSSSSAHFLQPFFSVTSYVKWSTTKVIWLFAQLSLYNLLFSGPSPTSAESTEIIKEKNRSCIVDITAYYANVTKDNFTQKGKAYCYNKFGGNDDCDRSFVVANVHKTNLFLLVVDASCGRCTTSKSSPSLGIPGIPEEIVRSVDDQEQTVCSKDQYRLEVEKCYISHNLETDYPCGRSNFVSASVLVLFLSFLVSGLILHI